MTEEILHKIYTEKGEITGIWLVLPIIEEKRDYTFPIGNTLGNVRKI